MAGVFEDMWLEWVSQGSAEKMKSEVMAVGEEIV